jgi:hypothetical protein
VLAATPIIRARESLAVSLNPKSTPISALILTGTFSDVKSSFIALSGMPIVCGRNCSDERE